MNINIPKGLWDTIFLTVHRKVLTSGILIVSGLSAFSLGVIIALLPVQDYEQVRGRICMTNDGYVFMPYSEKETKHD